MKYKTLSQLVKGYWLIDKAAAVGYLPIVANLIEGKTIDREEKEKSPIVAYGIIGAGAAAKVSAYKRYDDAPAGSIAIIKVSGPLMKEDQDCGGPEGTSTLGNRLQEADQHPNISGHVLIIDSPGGTVDGTEDFANKIKSASKPVVTYVDGLMGSAAYWIGSSSKEIIANGKSAIIGSIGTMISLPNFNEYFKQKGIEIHDIRADGSEDKNESFYQAEEGNYKPIRQEILNPLNEVFLAAVKSNRAGKLDLKKENTLTGKIYVAEQALEYGLIDSIGTLDAALQRASQLAQESNSINQKTNMSLKNWFSSSAKTEAETMQVSTAELEQLRTDAAAAQAELENVTAQANDLTAQLATANATIAQQATDLATANATIADLNAKVTEYGSQPGAMGTTPPKTGQEHSEAPKQHAFFDPKAEHNQVAFD